MMKTELPDHDLGSLQLTPEQARLELAIGLDAGRRVTLGKGAKIAGLNQSQFMQEIGGHGLTIHYTEADAQQNVATVDRLCPEP